MSSVFWTRGIEIKAIGAVKLPHVRFRTVFELTQSPTQQDMYLKRLLKMSLPLFFLNTSRSTVMLLERCRAKISLGFERGVLGGGSKVTDSLWPAPPQPHSPPCPPCGVDQQRGKRLRKAPGPLPGGSRQQRGDFPRGVS
ncbi:hypothetical protein F7725_000434, partial [Dissostichus mawsoni]